MSWLMGSVFPPSESEAGANHRGFPVCSPEVKNSWLYSPARLLQCKTASAEKPKNKAANLPKSVHDGEKKIAIRQLCKRSAVKGSIMQTLSREQPPLHKNLAPDFAGRAVPELSPADRSRTLVKAFRWRTGKKRN